MARDPFRPNPAPGATTGPMDGQGADNVVALPLRPRPGPSSAKPSRAQDLWLRRGLDQPGGKLPVFDHQGRAISERTIRSCIRHGWAEPWFNNPIKADWLVCRLTQAGRDAVQP